MKELKQTLEESLEVLVQRIEIFIPFLIPLAFFLIVAVIDSMVLETNAAFQMWARVVLLIAGLIVTFVCVNWGLYVIAKTVRTKKNSLENSFEQSLTFLIKFVSLNIIFGAIFGVMYLLFLVLATIDPLLGGVGLAVLILVFFGVLFYWGLAREALFYNNASVLGSLKQSKRLLAHRKLDFFWILVTIFFVSAVISAVGYVAQYINPFGLFLVVIGYFVMTVWVHVLFFVLFRKLQLGRA